MNENYLWDKTGSDPEIEKLEKSLRAFRCAETAAPVLPTKNTAFKLTNRRNIFRLGFAFAACAILIVGGAGVWNRLSDSNLNVETESAKVAAPSNPALDGAQSPLKKLVELPVKKSRVSSVRAAKILSQTTKQKVSNERKIFPANNSKNELRLPPTAPLETVAQLSGEEKYAYDQLMLALSITSAKLKIVKDKIDNSEKPNLISNNEK